MKKITQWFNALTPLQQKRTLLLFCAVFTLLLSWSLGYNKMTIKPADTPRSIGRATDSLTLKK